MKYIILKNVHLIVKFIFVSVITIELYIIYIMYIYNIEIILIVQCKKGTTK